MGVTVPPLQTTLGKDIAVTAVFFSSDRYVAIINGQLAQEGDIKGYEIVSIQPYAVKLKGPEGIFVQHIVFPKVKYPVPRKTNYNEN